MLLKKSKLKNGEAKQYSNLSVRKFIEVSLPIEFLELLLVKNQDMKKT